MDHGQFDALVRLVSTGQSRRTALLTLLGAVLVDPLAAAFAAKRQGQSRDRRRGQGKGARNGKAKRKGTGAGAPTRRNVKNRTARQAGAEATQCCSTGACAPGPGKNLQKCCYQRQNLTGKNFKGANLGSANLSGATLTGANLQGANLDRTCLVDADLRGVRSNASTNLSGVISCRTQTDSGENNAGCGTGTPCCPTCDAAHPCPSGQVCCAGACVRGACCTANDCAARTCRTAACVGRQCVYTPVSGTTGPNCDTICCDGTCGSTSSLCCGVCGNVCTPQETCCGETCVPTSALCGGTCGNICAAPRPNCCGQSCQECCTDAHCRNTNAPICLDFRCVDERVVRTFERVRGIVAEQLGVDEDTITMESRFIEDLGADSLDVVELIIAIEVEFGITITDEDVETIRTVGDAVRYIVAQGG